MAEQRPGFEGDSEDGETEISLISGIHNYCDRWCERCAFTSRCAAFRAEQELDGPDLDCEDRDVRNHGFWRRLQATFEQTIALVEEIAADQGIDLGGFAEEAAREPEEQEQPMAHDPLIEAATQYAQQVERWFESQPQAAMLSRDPSEPLPPGGDPDELPQTAGEAIAIVRWYQYQVVTKIVRGVTGRDHCHRSENELTDADGSIKVALIGMDRSLAAWAILQAILAPSADDIAATLLQLERLRLATEEAFPNARHFVRPGFDSITARQLH